MLPVRLRREFDRLRASCTVRDVRLCSGDAESFDGDPRNACVGRLPDGCRSKAMLGSGPGRASALRRCGCGIVMARAWIGWNREKLEGSFQECGGGTLLGLCSLLCGIGIGMAPEPSS